MLFLAQGPYEKSSGANVSFKTLSAEPLETSSNKLLLSAQSGYPKKSYFVNELK